MDSNHICPLCNGKLTIRGPVVECESCFKQQPFESETTAENNIPSVDLTTALKHFFASIGE